MHKGQISTLHAPANPGTWCCPGPSVTLQRVLPPVQEPRASHAPCGGGGVTLRALLFCLEPRVSEEAAELRIFALGIFSL